jgi:glycogen operon protein
MLHADWHNGLHALGLVLHGNAIEELDARGQPIVGDTLALLLNAGTKPVEFEMARHAAHPPARWQTLVDTHHPPDNERGIFPAQNPIEVPARGLLLLKELLP